MKYVFGIVGAVSIIAGFFILLGAKSAVHEIEAFMLFLIAAVLLTGAEIVAAVERLVAVGRGDKTQATGEHHAGMGSDVDPLTGMKIG